MPRQSKIGRQKMFFHIDFPIRKVYDMLNRLRRASRFHPFFTESRRWWDCSKYMKLNGLQETNGRNQ